MTRPPLLNDAELASWLTSVSGWSVEDRHLVGRFAIGYARGTRVIATILSTVERLDHHPTITLDYTTLRVELWTHDRGGVTSLDLTLAAAITDAVHESSLDTA